MPKLIVIFDQNSTQRRMDKGIMMKQKKKDVGERIFTKTNCDYDRRK